MAAWRFRHVAPGGARSDPVSDVEQAVPTAYYIFRTASTPQGMSELSMAWPA